MTPTCTLRYKGSTWRPGWALPWANHIKSRLMDMPPYHSRSCMNRELTFADGAGTMTKIVPTDDGGHIPAIYGELIEVVSKAKAVTVLLHWSTDHAIDVEPGYNLPYVQIYNLLEFELRMLKAYIEANLATGFIQHSPSPVTSLFFFPKDGDGGWRLCVNYWAPNKATVKIRKAMNTNQLSQCVKANSNTRLRHLVQQMH